MCGYRDGLMGARLVRCVRLARRVMIRRRDGVTMALSVALSNEEVQAAWVNLAKEVRTGVLLTLRNGRGRLGSHVPYVFGEHWTRAYIHVSRLALHTEYLLDDLAWGCLSRNRIGPGKNPLGSTADESSG